MTFLRSRVWLPASATIFSGLLLVSRLPLLSTRQFDPDELEHAHVAYYVTLGQVPYRDFFEHHTPLFHYLLAALFGVFTPDRSADAGLQALFAARHLTWGVSIGIVVMTFLLARRLADSATAWVAACLASGSIVVALRAIEIRPDGLSTLWWLGAVLALHGGMTAVEPRRASRAFAAGGIAIALAVLTSQKLLLAGPWVALLLAWYFFDRRFPAPARTKAVHVCWFGGCVAAVWLVPLLYFASRGAAFDFVHSTLSDNLRWKSETSAGTILRFVMRYEPWTFGLALAGAGVAVARMDDAARRVSHVILLVAAVGMFAGLFIIPVPYAQYCLTFVPLVAILGAVALVTWARALATDGDRQSLRLWVGVVAFAVVAAVGLNLSRPVVRHPAVYPAIVLSGAAGFIALSRMKCEALALAAVLAVLCILPAQWTVWMGAIGDEGQFAQIRDVMSRTRPGDIVLDGWTGLGVFRGHADYYWMFHPGVRAMLRPEEVTRIADAITSGRVVPGVVVLDGNLRQVSPDLTAFVEAHYHPTGLGPIYVK